MRLQKRWGQYILIDKGVAEQAISSLELKPEDTVLEIGPGTGVLTVPIKDKVKELIAVEIDKMSCAILQIKGIEAFNIDFLKMDLKDLPSGIKIISNLPYYITTPIISKILKEKVPFSLMVLTMQEEVAQRLTARPGSKEYGFFSVFTQFYSIPEIFSYVPRYCFKPVPLVDSCLVKFKRRKEIRLNFPEKFFFKIVEAGFSSRRKMLKNVLQEFGPLEEVTIDLSRRAETLSIKEFCLLAEELWKKQ